jgi:hypothetical protein
MGPSTILSRGVTGHRIHAATGADQLRWSNRFFYHEILVRGGINNFQDPSDTVHWIMTSIVHTMGF